MITTVQEAADFFYAPAQWKTSPDSAATDKHTLAWGKETGLVRSDQTEEMLAAWQLGTSAGCGFPRARGRGLEFVADHIAWGLIFDDIFNTNSPDPAAAAVVLDDTFHVLHADTAGPAPHPLRGASRALWDLLTRAATTMSPVWMCRFRVSTGEYLRGVANKSLIAALAEPPNVANCLAVRRDDIGLSMYLDMIELYRGFEFPPIVTCASGYQQMRTLVNEAVAIQNDILSLFRDRENEDSDTSLNIVAALERHHGKGTEHALGQARGLYHDRLTALDTAKKQFLRQCRSLGLDQHAMDRAELHAQDACDLVPGTFHAHITTATRGYLATPSALPSGSEMQRDYDGCTLRPWKSEQGR